MQTTTVIQTGKKTSVKELYDMLVNVTKSTIVNIIYLVDESKSKTVKGEKQIQKLVQINSVFLNHKYENKVRNLTGDETFVAEEMKGKTRISGTIIQSDKTNEYMIDGKVLNKESATVLQLYHNGKEITEAEAIMQQLFTPAYFDTTPKTMGRGLVAEEDDFRIINTYLSRIKAIKLFGEWYELN